VGDIKTDKIRANNIYISEVAYLHIYHSA